MALNSPVGPVQVNERIHVIDVLRGFALLGILLVNMEVFSQPAQAVMSLLGKETGTLDQAVAFIVRWLVEAKFYSLFSFLFGLGFSILIMRLEAKGMQVGLVYGRRLLALLGFGLVHALLIWDGDILVAYALIGWILLLFRKAKLRTIISWVLVLLAIPILFHLAGGGLFNLEGVAWTSGPATVPATQGQSVSLPQCDGEGQPQGPVDTEEMERVYRIYAEGSYGEILKQRSNDYFSFIGTADLFIVPSILAMFLLGLYFGKRGIFRDTPAQKPLFRKLLLWGYGIGLPANLLFALFAQEISCGAMTTTALIGSVGKTIGAPMLMLAYMATIVLLFDHPAWKLPLAVLAPGGRMALSNYLGQSLICTLIFYGYGLGLYGRVGRAAGSLLSIVIFLLQVAVSTLWLKRFTYGPMEWLWRSLTYWKRPTP